MQRHLKYIKTWGRRKAILIIVLGSSITLLGFSLYHFARRNHWLELEINKYPDFFDQAKLQNGWAYSGTAVSVISILCIFFLLIREVGTRRKIYEELKLQKESYQITVNSIAEGLIATGRKGEILFMNAAAERLTGWKFDEVQNHPLEKVYDVVNEESGQASEHIVNRILRNKKSVAFENNTLLHTRDKNKLIISNSGSPLFDAKGAMIGTVLVFNDITEKKKIERELKESERQYRTLIQNLPEAVYTCDVEGYVKLYNKAAVALWGREPVPGKDMWCGSWKIFNPDGSSLPLDSCPMAQSLQRARKIYGHEITIQRPDGSFRHVLPYPSPLFDVEGRLTGGINMLIDVTEKREKEILIKQSEEKYRTLIEQAADAILISKEDGSLLEVNYAASKMLGYTTDELSLMNITDLYTEAELTEKPFRHEELVNGLQLLVERNIVHRLGSLIPVEITLKMMSDRRFMAIVRDISERKKADKEIRDYQFALDVSSIIDVTDKNGRITHVNENFCSISKYSKEELLGKDHRILNAGHHDEAFIKKMWDIISSGLVWRDEIKNKAKDGTTYWVDTTIVPFLDEEGVPFQYITIRTDITPRKESEVFITGVLDALSSHVAVINAAGTIIKTNAPWEKFALSNGVTGLEKCAGGANYLEVCQKAISGGDTIAAEAMEGIMNVLNGSIPEFYLEYPCHSPQEERWFHMRVMKFENAETLVVIEHQDMTERKKSELRTLKAIERYDILSKATSDTIWDWDFINNKILYNSGITKMFGYKVSEVRDVFNWWLQKVHPDDLQFVTDSYSAAIKNVKQNLQLEYRFRCADGSYRYIYDRAFVLYDNNQQPLRMIGAMQDVTYAREEEKRITKATIDAQETERQYIGRELHDNVNQILSAALLSLGMVKGNQGDSKRSTEFIELTREHTLNAINEIRKLSHELAPASYDDNTLKDLFVDLLNGINLNNEFEIDLHFDEKACRLLSADIQVNLYRILQEQVKNILKYAEAGAIEVSVSQANDILHMRIADNGKGFDTSKAKSGIGISNMKKRAESLAGKFMLNSRPGKGCEIIVEIPAKKLTLN